MFIRSAMLDDLSAALDPSNLRFENGHVYVADMDMGELRMTNYPGGQDKTLSAPELAVLQALFNAMLRIREPMARIRLADFLNMTGVKPKNHEAGVDFAIGLLQKLSNFHYVSDGLDGQSAGSTCGIVLWISQDDESDTIQLYSPYLEKLIEINPDGSDLSRYAPVPEDHIVNGLDHFFDRAESMFHDDQD